MFYFNFFSGLLLSFLRFHGVVSFFLVFPKVLLFLHLVYEFCILVLLFCALHVYVEGKFVLSSVLLKFLFM